MSGIIRSGRFTAIMGPSGSGKTTLLNFISGRMESRNLDVYGKLMINTREILDIEKFNHLISYVQQDDVLLPTFTPKEALTFVANLRV